MTIYRDRLRACPGCGHPMTAVAVDDPARGSEAVEVDRCEHCGGSFLEFFDGEPIRLAREVLEARPTGASKLPARPLSCPDCGTPMVRRAYLDTGVELSRCETCLAVFVSTDELQLLASAMQALPPERPPTLFERILAMLGAG